MTSAPSARRAKRKRATPEDYRLLFAPDGFRWAGEFASGLPIVCERDGSVCEPLVRFFGWSFRHKRTALSSLRDEAYILREWWAFLDGTGRRWDAADDQALIEWREVLKAETASASAQQSRDRSAPSAQRIARKMAVVFTFYNKAKAAMLLDRDLVGPLGPVSCRGGAVREWACAEDAGRKTVRRKTPDDGDVGKVLTHLRNTGEDAGTRDRNWLIGRVMAEAGLRRDEVVKLSVNAIEAALAKEGVRVPEPKEMAIARAAGWNPRLASLDAVADWSEARQGIVSGLDALERRNRTNIYVRVTGKGSVTRDVPFPIPLVRDLLEIGVWGIRRDQRQRWGKAFHPPGPSALFLSEKTRSALEAAAVGNLVLMAFKECGVEGSGHRLRAHFATKLAERLWAEEFANNGFRWDQRVENLVLDKVAEALGHAQPTTTCRHYLDLGRMAYFKVGSKSALKSMRKAVNAMAVHHRRLPAEFFDKIAALLERRAAGVAGLDDLLDAILADPDFNVPGDSKPVEDDPNPSRGGRPNLRVVPTDRDHKTERTS